MAVHGAKGAATQGFVILSAGRLPNIPEVRFMSNTRTLLLIDDDPAHAKVFREALAEASGDPFEGKWVRTLAEGIARLKNKGIWAIFLNLHLGGTTGLTIFECLLAAAPDVPTLVLGGSRDKALATKALKRGAKDYLIEGHIDRYSLARAIRNMAERETAEDNLLFSAPGSAQQL